MFQPRKTSTKKYMETCRIQILHSHLQETGLFPATPCLVTSAVLSASYQDPLASRGNFILKLLVKNQPRVVVEKNEYSATSRVPAHGCSGNSLQTSVLTYLHEENSLSTPQQWETSRAAGADVAFPEVFLLSQGAGEPFPAPGNAPELSQDTAPSCRGL